MGAVPKHKTSTFRKGRRRAVIKLKKPQTVTCPQCGAAKLPHHACDACGFYSTK